MMAISFLMCTIISKIRQPRSTMLRGVLLHNDDI